MRKEQSIKANNNQMEEKGMKSRFIHFKKRFVPAVSGALMGVMLMSTLPALRQEILPLLHSHLRT